MPPPRDDDRRSPPRVSAEILDRLPPQSADAEKAVLGSLLLDPDLCDEVALILRREDFYSDANARLFGQIMAMHNEGVRIDPTLLVDRLIRDGELDAVGGMAYLADVAGCVPHAANAGHYATIVRDKGTLRAMIHASTEILRDSYEPGMDAREMLNRAEEKIFGILENKGAVEVAPLSKVLEKSLLRLDARMKQGEGISGVETGFVEFDNLTGGLHESELIILAARPSMGKTALAANIAEHASIHARKPTLFVSLEMSAVELGDRMLCSFSRVDAHKLRNGTVSNDERRKLVAKSGEMSSAPLFIDDNPSRTMTEIAATARRLKRREGLSLIVIDYLQLIEPDNPRDPRQEQVARIARRLKGLARELKVPLICLAQLNRQAEMTKDNRPRLSHLRESGAIEQDADVVMFVHREEYYLSAREKDEVQQQGDPDHVLGTAEIILSKQRNGPVGDVKLVWFAEYTRFDNLLQREYAELSDANF